MLWKKLSPPTMTILLPGKSGQLSIARVPVLRELQLSFSEVNPSRDPSNESESSLRSHWSTDELQALVQFVLESGKADVWPPSHQSTKVWSAAASFIHRKVGTAHLRTSTYLV